MHDHYRVLIMEGHAEHATALMATLQQAGYTVALTNDGSEGWQWAFANHPDVVLLDVELQTLDGFQVLMRLKHTPNTARIPIIMVTDRTWMSEWRLASKLGASLCLNIQHCIDSDAGARRLCECVACLLTTREVLGRQIPLPHLPHTRTAHLPSDRAHWQPGRMTMCPVYADHQSAEEASIPDILEQEVGTLEREVGEPYLV